MRLQDRTGCLYIFVGDTGTRQLLVQKPDLKLVQTKNIANQQVIGSIVAALHGGSAGLQLFHTFGFQFPPR